MKRKSMHKVMTAALAAAVSFAAWAPTPAQAQSPQTTRFVDAVSVSMEPNHRFEDGTLYAGIDECTTLVDSNPDFSVTFETTVIVAVEPELYGGVYHYNFERGQGSQINCRRSDGDLHENCGGQLDEDDVSFVENEVDAQISFQELTGLTSVEDCQQGDLNRNYYVQLRIRDYGGTGVDFAEWGYAEARLVVDLIRPERPTLSDVMATENSIRVEFQRSSSSDVRRHLVVFSNESFEEGDLVDDINLLRSPRAVEGEESGRISASLEGGSTVYVGMVARDQAGNYSAVSAPMETTVVETSDFWDFYVGAGGEEEGGHACHQTAAGSTTAVVVIALLMLSAIGWRRRSERAQQRAAVVFEAKDGRR